MSLLSYVKLLEGKTNKGRREAIKKFLKKHKIPFAIETFHFLGTKENIVVSLGKGKKDILVMAHYDAVPFSPGANDNASAVAVMFDVLLKLKKYKSKNTFRFCFFGGEELNCIGSRAYVKKHGVENIIAVYNMELVGMGDVLGIWPVTTDKSKALVNLRKTIKKLGYYFEVVGKPTFLFGDHKSFRRAGCKHAFCLTVVPKKQKDAIRKFIKQPLGVELIRFTLRLVPKMFRYYHTPRDISKTLNESALKMTADVIYHAVKNMDA